VAFLPSGRLVDIFYFEKNIKLLRWATSNKENKDKEVKNGNNSR